MSCPKHKAANLKRKIKMLRYHASMRGEDGKSIVAVRGGEARMRGDKTIAMETALRRWYPDADTTDVTATLARIPGQAGGNETG